MSHKLRAAEVLPPDCSFEEQLWVELSLSGPDRLLIGCIYRSPSGTGERDTDDLIKLFEHVSAAGYSHLLSTGDFNMAQIIDWELEMSTAPEGHFTQRFVNCTQDLFLQQHVLEPTRFR